MNESQLDPMDRTSTNAPRRTKTPAIWWTLVAINGFFAAYNVKEFVTTGDQADAVMAVFLGLATAGLMWELLRSPTPAPRQNLSLVLGFALFFGLTAYCAYNFFTTGELWDAYWAVIAGLMSAVIVWGFLRARRDA